MVDDLDSIVKGAPVPGAPAASAGPSSIVGGPRGDPLSHTPSSPSMIYLNLLILEASLRAQYLELRARRRHHTFFLSILAVWLSFWTYMLFYAPREDGSGQGGSVYWAVEVFEKICFMGGVITAVLVWGTGIVERGIKWPRRWYTTANRGLRAFNCKLVLIKHSWWAEMLLTTGWFLTYGVFSTSATGSYRRVDAGLVKEVERELNISHDTHHYLPAGHNDEDRGGRGHEEDLAPGGDYVKLLLLPKPFSATFRENWELYRTEYWERENERRARLRAKLKERDRRVAREKWGWSWWLPWRKPEHIQVLHVEKPHLRHAGVEKEHKRVRSGSIRQASVSSTRSQTPTVDVDESGITRRPSTGSNASDRRKKKLALSSAKGSLRRAESRSVTPDYPSPLARESSVASDASLGQADELGAHNLTRRPSGPTVQPL